MALQNNQGFFILLHVDLQALAVEELHAYLNFSLAERLISFSHLGTHVHETFGLHLAMKRDRVKLISWI